MKKFIVLMFIAAIIFSFIPGSRAADQTVTCTNSGCSGISDSLFDNFNVAPGESVTKTIEIINDHNETMKLALSPTKNALTDDEFLKQVAVTVVNGQGTVNFSGSLADFLTAYIDLEKLESGQRENFTLSFSLADVGNEFQGKQAKFSFDLKIDQEVPGSGDSGVGGGVLGGVAAGASPSPVILGATTFFPQVQSFLESVLGEATPAGSVQGESFPPARPWWLVVLLLPGLLWLWKRRRMNA